MLLALAVGLLWPVAAGAGAEPARLAWVAPEQLRAMDWSGEAAGLVREVAHPARWLSLAAGELLVLPVRVGERVRIEGEGLIIGFGSGSGALPDAVVWVDVEARRAVRDLRVPTWGSVRFVVVRSAESMATRVRVRLAAPRREPMAWFRADEAVWDWLGDPEAPPPELADPLDEVRPLVRWLAAARQALGGPGIGPRGLAYLQARWLAGSLRHRPVQPPFFLPVPVEFAGGRAPAAEQSWVQQVQATHQLRVARRGQSVTVRSSQADVVTMLVRARAVGTTIVRIAEGDVLLRELRVTVPMRGYDEHRWTSPRLLRLVPPPGAAIRVEVVKGTVLMAARGYQAKTSVFDDAHRRHRRALLTQASRTPDPADGERGLSARLAGALARAELQRSTTARQALQSWAGRAGLPPEARALVLHEMLRRETDAAAAIRVLAELWRVTAPLAAARRDPLRRAALEHVAATQHRPIERRDVLAEPGRTQLSSASTTGGGSDDWAIVELLTRASSPYRDGGRPTTAWSAERLAALDGAGSSSNQQAALLWRRSAPWANIAPTSATGVTTRMLPVLFDYPGERCPMHGPMGVRWVQLGPRPLRLDVADAGGSHSRIRMVVDPSAGRRESQIQVDRLVATVHGAAGLQSTVVVEPGHHELRTISGPAVLARVPSEQEIDCRLLRDGLRWIRLRDQAVFAVGAGHAPTVASVIVASESVTALTSLRVHVGPTSYLAWLRPGATGAVEVPVPPEQTHITVQSNHPILMRLRLRRHRAPKPERRVDRGDGGARPPPQVLIQQVERRTRALRRTATAAAARRERLARARSLEVLGFGRLAAIDRTRGGAGPGESQVRPARSAFAAQLPPGSPPVVPLGDLPRIGPVSAPADDGPLGQVLAARDRGATTAELVTMLRPTADGSLAADALLLAILAEQAGHLELASRSLERIGRDQRSGQLLARAARVRLDLAAQSKDAKHSLLAYLVARDALQLQGPAEAVLARLSGAITWDRVGADRAAGSALVEQIQAEDDEGTLGDRVRRALVAAPSYAALTRGRPVVVGLRRVDAEQVQLDWLCHSLEGARERCEMHATIDRAPVQCEPEASAPAGAAGEPASDDDSAPAASGDISRPTRCTIAVPEQARRLVVTPPADQEILGWVAVRQIRDAERIPTTRVARWIEVDGDRPFRTAVAGPAVLRVAARAVPGRTEPLQVEIRPMDAPGAARSESMALDPRRDPSARRYPSKRRLSRASVLYLTIPDAGRQRVTIASSAGRVLLRVAVARAVGLPRPRRSVAAAPPLRPDAARAELSRAAPLRLPPVGEDPAPGWLTLGATIGFVGRDMIEADDDERDDFGEFALHLRSELEPSRLWMRASVFERVRDGPPSHGAEVRLSLASRDLLPGAFAQARLVSQQLAPGWAAGAHVTVGLLWSAPVTTELRLTPMALMSLRYADDSGRGELGVDRQVYSPFGASRPRSLDLLLRATHRPHVDLFTRYAVRARLAPEFDGLDNVDLQIRGDLLGGGGLAPWARLDGVVSYRPPSPLRTRGYVRGALSPSLSFWRWLTREGCLSLRGGVSTHLDVPSVMSSATGVTGFVTLGYDHVFRRGVTDLPLLERPFRERLEEEHGPVRRVQPRAPMQWREQP